MDFDFPPSSDDAAALAATILTDHATPTRMREVELEGTRFDPVLWKALADAGLLSLAIPEEYDGAGLGLIELCRVLIEVGRKVAPAPLATHGAAAVVIAEFGTAAQKAEWLPRAAAGAALLTAAVTEEREHAPTRPTTTASQSSDGYVLNGAKTVVPAGTQADLFLVPATTSVGVGVFLVTPGDAGVTVNAQRLSDGDAVAQIDLTDVQLSADRLLGAPDSAVSVRLLQLVTVAACAVQVGVVEGAVRLTAEYAKVREQFGRPIGTFQAVSQRLADAYIDSRFEALTLWQAAWRLSEGLPAEVEVATAKLWAADAGHRVAHTTVHVHGGVGIDLDGEAHRYFTAAKRFEFTYGGTTEQSLAIGRALAATPV